MKCFDLINISDRRMKKRMTPPPWLVPLKGVTFFQPQLISSKNTWRSPKQYTTKYFEVNTIYWPHLQHWTHICIFSYNFCWQSAKRPLPSTHIHISNLIFSGTSEIDNNCYFILQKCQLFINLHGLDLTFQLFPVLNVFCDSLTKILLIINVLFVL